MHRFKVLRVGLDWATFYYNIAVKTASYQALESYSELEIAGVLVRFEVYVWKGSTVLSGEGWYIRVQDPEYERDDKIKQYPIEIQARGHAWAGGVDFVRAVGDWEAVLGVDPKPQDRIPGRIDLAADIWIRDGNPSPKDLYRLITANADEELIPQLWALRATRIQKDTGASVDVKTVPFRAVGQIKRLQTVYIGSRKGIQLGIYEKTKDFSGNTRDLIEGEWARAGWIRGEGIVPRFEFRFSREAIREQSWPILNRDGEVVIVDGNKINLYQALEAVPDVWDTCLTRFRLCPYNGVRETRKRPEAPLWAELRRNPPSIAGPGFGAGLVAVKRGYDVDGLRTRTIRGLQNLELATGSRKAATLAFFESGQDTEERREYLDKSPWKGFYKRWTHGNRNGDRREGGGQATREE